MPHQTATRVRLCYASSVIFRPLGSIESLYDIRVTTVRSDPLVSVGGEAQLERGVTVLRVDVKTPLPVPAGMYSKFAGLSPIGLHSHCKRDKRD
jgi:hypothetical protein